MAVIGDILPMPETGWKRYDDTDSNIIYEGAWEIITSAQYYGHALKYTKQIEVSKAKFNFTGNKLRIIALDNNYYTQGGVFYVKVDNSVEHEFICNSLSNKPKTLVCDLSLEEGEHYVELYCKSTGSICFDAIDIDENGELKPYNENPTIIKYLIQDNKTGNSLSLDTDTITNLGNQTISEELYLNNGFYDVTLLNNTYTKSKVYGTKDSDTATGQIFSVSIPSYAININSINLE